MFSLVIIIFKPIQIDLCRKLYYFNIQLPYVFRKLHNVKQTIAEIIKNNL